MFNSKILSKRTACGFIVGLVLSFSLNAGADGPTTTPQPGYDPFTATVLQNPNAVTFDVWQILGRWKVSETELQDVLDVIDDGRYNVQTGRPDQGYLFFTVRYSRALVVNIGPPLPGTYDPTSSMIFTVTVIDNDTGMPVILNLGDYAEDVNLRNTFIGATVAKAATFKWKIRESAGVLQIAVNVKSKKGFKFETEITADASSAGSFASLDPDARPFRFLTDPEGTHPTIRFGRKNGSVPLTSITADLHGGKLMTPGGSIAIDDAPVQGVELRRLSETPVKFVED
jgi:hypothetical protein